MTPERRRIRGWMLFDVAQQPYATLGLTFVFGPYFAEVAAHRFAHLGPEAAAARAQTLWANANVLAGLAVALTAPVLGALVDASGRKLPWIVGLSVPCALCAWSLWWLHPDGANLFPVLALFWIGFAAGEAALNVNNAQLPAVAPPGEVGRVSGAGAAMGYWGGVAALALMLLLLADGSNGLTLLGRPPAFGLDGTTREGTRAVGPFIALWLLAFLLPFALWTRDRGDPPSPRRPRPSREALRRAWADLRRRPSLLSFLGASMLYRDALAGSTPSERSTRGRSWAGT